jgi:hypothetical protein
MDVILTHLEFSPTRATPVDYRKHLATTERFNEDDQFIVKESLHPILKSVFKLDSNLLLVVCRGRIVESKEFMEMDVEVGTKGAKKRWAIGLVEIHMHLFVVFTNF